MENLDTVKNDHTTQVTTQITDIKMINEETDNVATNSFNGKLNVTECKALAKQLGLTFVSKTNRKETFEVNTNELHKLKL